MNCPQSHPSPVPSSTLKSCCRWVKKKEDGFAVQWFRNFASICKANRSWRYLSRVAIFSVISMHATVGLDFRYMQRTEARNPLNGTHKCACTHAMEVLVKLTFRTRIKKIVIAQNLRNVFGNIITFIPTHVPLNLDISIPRTP